MNKILIFLLVSCGYSNMKDSYKNESISFREVLEMGMNKSDNFIMGFLPSIKKRDIPKVIDYVFQNKCSVSFRELVRLDYITHDYALKKALENNFERALKHLINEFGEEYEYQNGKTITEFAEEYGNIDSITTIKKCIEDNLNRRIKDLTI